MEPVLFRILLLVSAALWSAGQVQAQAPTPVVKREPYYEQFWQVPEVEQRIRRGIQLRFVDAQSNALKNVAIKLEQTQHDFLFGCNLFMLEQFSTPELNQRYEDAFRSVFNLAVVPFFWLPGTPFGRVRERTP